MTSPELAAVLFDWGGTLTPWHAVDVRASWLAYAGAYHRGTDDGAPTTWTRRTPWY